MCADMCTIVKLEVAGADRVRRGGLEVVCLVGAHEFGEALGRFERHDRWTVLLAVCCGGV